MYHYQRYPFKSLPNIFSTFQMRGGEIKQMKKLRILFVIVMISVMAIPLAPTYGGDYGIEQRGIFGRYRVNAWAGYQEMASTEDAYVWHGIGFDVTTQEFRKEMAESMPVDIQFFIDGEEVKLARYAEARPNQWYVHSPGPDLWWSGEHKGSVNEIWFMYYQTFDAGYFEVGVHELHVEYYYGGGIFWVEFDGILNVT